jgi:predicted acetyltransferase
MTCHLVKPSLEYLPAYRAALERGWSPDNVRRIETARAHLTEIQADAAGFVGRLDDPEARGGPMILPDGSSRPRLPGYSRWIWDGEFCGSIGFRWQPGTAALPPHVLGHIGYAVVAWKQGRHYATQALRQLLPDARARGLTHVDLTSDPDNIPSQRVILTNGGRFIERFRLEAAYGGGDALRFRIVL